jgi:hypothetical protein
LPKGYRGVKFLVEFKMIAFDLFCSNGHKFECWFKDSISCEEQIASGMITCPICNDDQIEKAFSPFMIKKDGVERKEELDPQQACQVLQKVSDYIDKHFEDVGDDFFKEALKIHSGETEKRNIKGTATTEEEVILKEEGVPFFKVPVIKKMLN